MYLALAQFHCDKICTFRYAKSGESISDITVLGDINGDGYDDFGLRIINDSVNYFIIYFGSPDLATDTTKYYKIPGQKYNVPTSIFRLGDINKDGFADFAILYTKNYGLHQFRFYYGNTIIDTSAYFTLDDNLDNVAALGDINGDGYNDFMLWLNYLPVPVSSYPYPNNTGTAKLYFGGKTIDAAHSINFSDTVHRFIEYNAVNIGSTNGISDFAMAYKRSDLISFPTDSAWKNKVCLFHGGKDMTNIPFAVLDSTTDENYGEKVSYSRVLFAGEQNKDWIFVSSNNNVYAYSDSKLQNIFKKTNKYYSFNFVTGPNSAMNINDFVIINEGYMNTDSVVVGKADFYFFGSTIDTTHKITIYGTPSARITKECAYLGRICDAPGDKYAIMYSNGDIDIYSVYFLLSDDVKNTNKLIPVGFNLSQNYPNPFNPSTEIEYSVQTASRVEITVYNALGQKVKTLVSEAKTPGNYKASFNAGQLCSGVYFYRFSAQSLESGKEYFGVCKKMLLLK